ncbi:cellular nucleic acid-binding protein, partial [Trifolium medium]|nr:cellular nucleic acid-binding protein [Trifolium medium]
GDPNHKADQCPKGVVCFNCKETGHKSSVCKKPRVAGGKVFALDGGDVETDSLIRGTCFINNTPLSGIIDTGATH